MSHISTYTGKLFNIFDPQPADICLEDIAHALAMNCRYNGHVERFYSVAEHSVVASLQCPPEYALVVLMHDAAEAYMTDVPRPIKQAWPEFSSHETGVLMAILGALGLPAIDVHGWAAITEADLRMLATEREQLLPNVRDAWPCLYGVLPYGREHAARGGEAHGDPLELECWDPARGKAEFLARFSELGGEV